MQVSDICHHSAWYCPTDTGILFEGQYLTKRILKREEIFIQNTDGSGNRDLLHSVNALFRYVSSDIQGLNDGLDYEESPTEADTIRNTFHKILIPMEREWNYEMMMNTIYKSMHKEVCYDTTNF